MLHVDCNKAATCLDKGTFISLTFAHHTSPFPLTDIHPILSIIVVCLILFVK